MRIIMILGLLLSAAASFAGEGKQLLWGDTHLHTTYSMDAFTVGNHTADPDTAYRYAKGLPVIHPYHRARIQIETPLDFLVVSDHAEFLGVIRHIYHEGVPTEDLGLIDTIKAKLSGAILSYATDTDWGTALFSSQLPEAMEASAAAKTDVEEGVQLPGIPDLPQVRSAAWSDIGAAAEAHNEPGKFTALLGWEWSSIPGGSNLHRIVVTDSDAKVAGQYIPFSFIDSPYPEDLWAWLEKTSENTGAEFIAIPHNSNISKGYMFDTKTLRGAEFSEEYVEARRKWERVVEITQIKGDSETHPDLSPEDPFADFETYPFYIQQAAFDYKAGEGDYIRSALKRGLSLEAKLGSNPYEFGVIGSTDAHTGMASAEEDNFHGKLAPDSIPDNKGEKRIGREGGPTGWDMSASGLAAVWAEDNTRESVVAALRRREVYATSGPRIGVQFFAGRDYGEEILVSEDLYASATATGVPMGGELRGGEESPVFVVLANRDPVGANLDRVQIVKGWVDSLGIAREKVHDVVWSGERIRDEYGVLPEVGNTVDVETASYSNDIGAPALSAVWQDPEFDTSESAFYYVRVLQIPTPRHSLYDAVALGQDNPAEHPATIQERAYTSPIWYRPAN